MPISHKKRTSEGQRGERLVLKKLRRRGIRAALAPRGKPWDIVTEGGKKIEVKAARETTTKGSDGNPITGVVFSNISKGADVYHFMEMSKDRKRQKTSWNLMPEEVPGVTFTVTAKRRSELPSRTLEQALEKKASFVGVVARETLIAGCAQVLFPNTDPVMASAGAIMATRAARTAKQDYETIARGEPRRARFKL